MGTEKKRKLINVSEKPKELGKEWIKIQLAVYVFTREDCVSAFKGKSKTTPVLNIFRDFIASSAQFY